MTPAGFPHSEISGSKPVNDSPKLIAAYHVLHRLPMPRHPPLALSSLSIKLDQTIKNSTYCNPRIGLTRFPCGGGRQTHRCTESLRYRGFITTLLFNYQRSLTGYATNASFQNLRPEESLHQGDCFLQSIVWWR
jgi:hypothetical protein